MEQQRKYRLPGVIRQLLSESSREAWLDAMKPILEEIGVKHFSLHRLAPAPGIPFDRIELGQRKPAEWTPNRFLHHQNPFNDPVLQHCRDAIEPFFWGEYAGRARVEKARKEFGIEEI